MREIELYKNQINTLENNILMLKMKKKRKKLIHMDGLDGGGF